MTENINTHITIMLIDDDEDDRKLFAAELQELDPSVKLITAEDGIEAFLSLEDESQRLPDFILLDLNMPKKTGFEVLAEIKNDELLKNIPVIIYTTSINKNEKEETINHGAISWITKTASKEELRKIISEMLEMYKSR